MRVTGFRRARRSFAALACCTLLFACTEEDATDIGGPLIPDDGVQTFEVFLEPAQYLLLDTAFSGYVNAFRAGIRQVMTQFEGVTSAHALYRYTTLPATLTVRDSAGTTRTDSTPSYPNGYLLIRVDTTATIGTGTISVLQTTQEWNAPSATWTVRSDTGGVRELWSQPGGTTGASVGSAAWPSGSDTVMIQLDSATIVALTDTANHARGALVRLTGVGVGGSTLRIMNATLRINGKSRIRPDTTIVVTQDPSTSTFIFTPDPPTTAGGAVVSGVPAWRGILQLVEEWANLLVPCPGQGCSVRLRDAHLNIAELMLRPTGSAPGFAPEDSIAVNANLLLELPNVPIERSPVSSAVGGTRSAIARTRFRTTDTGPEVALPITAMINAIVRDTATTVGERVPRRLALMTSPEASTFGFGAFRPGPRLRLVLTITTEQR